jgi:hypothetical protein
MMAFSQIKATGAILKSNSAASGFSVAAMLCASIAAASAQNAPAAPPPKPDAGTTVQPNCIDENDTFTMVGNRPALVIALANKCEARMSCRVFAYVISAKGPALGRGTLVLAPASHGASAKKSFTMWVKMTAGNSQSTRECHVF